MDIEVEADERAIESTRDGLEAGGQGAQFVFVELTEASHVSFRDEPDFIRVGWRVGR